MNFIKKSFNKINNTIEINKLNERLKYLEKEKNKLQEERFMNKIKIIQREITMPKLNKLINATNENIKVLKGNAFNGTNFDVDFIEFIHVNRNNNHLTAFKKLYDKLEENNKIIEEINYHFYYGIESDDYYDLEIDNIETKINSIQKSLNLIRNNNGYNSVSQMEDKDLSSL